MPFVPTFNIEIPKDPTPMPHSPTRRGRPLEPSDTLVGNLAGIIGATVGAQAVRKTVGAAIQNVIPDGVMANIVETAVSTGLGGYLVHKVAGPRVAGMYVGATLYPVFESIWNRVANTYEQSESTEQ